MQEMTKLSIPQHINSLLLLKYGDSLFQDLNEMGLVVVKMSETK
jgi:hypothetical protein